MAHLTTITARADRAMIDNAHAIKLTVHIGSLGAWGIGTTWEDAEQNAHKAAKEAYPGLRPYDWNRRRLMTASLFLARDASLTEEQVVALVRQNNIAKHLVQIILQ